MAILGSAHVVGNLAAMARVLSPLQWVGRYSGNVLIALDQLGNALLAGDPDETLSSRCGKRRSAGCRVCCALCWLLDWVHRGHCDWAVERDEGTRS